MDGYALAQHIKAVSDQLLQIEEGSLYPALQRMLKAGWLESEMGVSPRKPPVRIYRGDGGGSEAAGGRDFELRKDNWRNPASTRVKAGSRE